MQCPNCYCSMYEEDDLGGGDKGYECPCCGHQIFDEDLPCPKGDDGEPCCRTETEWGGYECLMCGRDM